MKKGITRISGMLLAAAVYFFSFCPASYAADFPDVPTDHKNYSAITFLAQKGVIAGYDDGTFDPEREITRTEFCALMARTLGYSKEGYAVGEIPFSDVSRDYWGAAYISYCYELGLIDGMGDGTFAPAAKVTLEQTVKMAVCAVGKQEEALSVNGPKWYTGYAQVGGRYGLLTAVDCEFGENAMRKNVAQVVYNMLESGLVKLEEAEDGKPEASEETGSGAADGDEQENSALSGIVAEFAKKDYSEVKTIVIDAGHNYSGMDKGAENQAVGAKEEVITWQIADKLRRALADMGYTVIMTRENVGDSIANTSVTDSLQARVDIAHDALADLFISLHCNAGGGSGTEVYCFSTEGYAGRLAELVERHITAETELYGRGVKTANFFVIKNTLMPAILIETGFIDSTRDIEILTSEDGQEQIAKAIAAAVSEYDGSSLD